MQKLEIVVNQNVEKDKRIKYLEETVKELQSNKEPAINQTVSSNVNKVQSKSFSKIIKENAEKNQTKQNNENILLCKINKDGNKLHEAKTILSNVKIVKTSNSDNAVKIICADNKNALMGLDLLKDNKIDARIIEKRKPRMIIQNIYVDIKDDEIMQEIKNKNLELFTDDDSMELIKVIKKPTSKDVVISVKSCTREKIIQNSNFVYLDFQRCHTKDHVDVLQCYKCQQFGHRANECKHDKNVCMYCSENHQTSACTSKKIKENYKCYNCGNNHTSNHLSCKIYQLQVEKAIKRIDYSLN